jgi:hypothetical protein
MPMRHWCGCCRSTCGDDGAANEHATLDRRENARKALDSGMQRAPVESSSIASIGYAPQERVLELEFRQSGEVYQYFDVPAEEYTAFLAAGSKGTT